VIVIVYRRCRHGAIRTSEIGDGGRAGEVVECDDRNDKQDEDDECDEDVDKFVDARAAVKRDVGV
jgi:hypothetical protein